MATPPQELTLKTPRVLVTRAARGASSLAEALQRHGLTPVLVPAITTVEPGSFAALDQALQHPEVFHWLLFTSATAVESFAARHRTIGAPPLPEALRIAVIGPATARELDLLGRAPNLIPPQAVAESLAEALHSYARQPDGSPTRFLLPRAEEARDHLPDTLRAAGAEVSVVPAYRTVVPSDSIALTRRLFRDPASAPEAITFTSSSTARNLLALCEAANVTLPSAALRISIGPVTTQTLRDLGLPPHAEAPEANVAALAETVVRALRSKKKQP